MQTCLRISLIFMLFFQNKKKIAVFGTFYAVKEPDMDKNELYRDIGNKIRARRNNLNMTISELARDLNKSISTVSKYETGSIQISIDDLLDISRILKMDFFSLIPDSYLTGNEANNARYEKYYTEKVYVYWYSGDQDVIRLAVIENNNITMRSSMYFDAADAGDYYRCKFIYYGDVFYSDTGVVWVFHNDNPPFDTLTLRSPTLNSIGNHSIGLMSCITYYYQNVAVKVAVCRHPVSDRSSLSEELMVSRADIKALRDSNFFTV